MTEDPCTIRVSDLLDLQQSIVDSGAAVAAAIIESLQDGKSILVVLDGLPGAPSSFFNAIIYDLLESNVSNRVADQVQFVTESKSIRLSLQRSLEAFNLEPGMVRTPAA